ncbi:hypothetical protein [Piscirickettsia litoralis]|uniref:Uncharacterized protein n=1 Tax=Piscirickettsia litoralis TaxID=1891921 RepID=A0ABX3A1A9_9GAMM|nr:hypothetical protein [Piscirickettsia litoralis]ODN41451.1 hypothetical protein BGC07_15120 [Piscirickettsia litoralis]
MVEIYDKSHWSYRKSLGKLLSYSLNRNNIEKINFDKLKCVNNINDFKAWINSEDGVQFQQWYYSEESKDFREKFMEAHNNLKIEKNINFGVSLMSSIIAACRLYHRFNLCKKVNGPYNIFYKSVNSI